MIDEEVVVVVVVVADSTGCNGSASRLTRRTRLDLSTYRKHRERGGQETPTIFLIVFAFLFLFSFCRNDCLDFVPSVSPRLPFRARIILGSETQNEKSKEK